MKRYNIKQIRIFILLLCVFAIHIQLNAKEVKFEIVKKIAINAYALNTGKTHTEIIEVIPISVDNKNVYYIFNFENGYIIVAGDDVATPILAYGLGSNIDLNKVPPNLLFLLNNYKNNIHLAQEQNIHQSKKNIETITLDLTNKKQQDITHQEHIYYKLLGDKVMDIKNTVLLILKQVLDQLLVVEE